MDPPLPASLDHAEINVFDSPSPFDCDSAATAVAAATAAATAHSDWASASAAAPPSPSASAAVAAEERNVFELDSAGTAAALSALPPPPEAPPAVAAAAGSSSAAPLLPASAPTGGASGFLSHITLDLWAQMFWSTASNKQKLCQFMYNYSLSLSFAIQLLCILLFLAVEPTAIKFHISFTPGMAFLLVLCQLAQLVVIVLSHLGMARELQALYVRPGKVWAMYLSTVLSFAALYFTFFCFQRSSFQVDGYAASGAADIDPNDPDAGAYEDLQTVNDIPTVFVFFCYFSGAIMTSVGFGDITPTLWYSQAFTNVQMLLGTMYHVGVFGLTLSHFRTYQKVAESREAEARRAGTWNTGLVMGVWVRFANLRWVRRVAAHPWTRASKRFVIRHLVLVCLVFQTLNTLLLFSIPDPFRSLKPRDPGYAHKVVVLVFITLFQTGMFLGVMWVSIRLVKQINNADITAGFLIQSFLATALLFGGIYFVLFAATPNHQFSHHSAFDLTIFEVLYVFVHFSLTVMTTTGFGDVYARGVLARIFVLAQMLISILYSAVIIGLGTSQLIDMQAAKSEADYKSKEAAAEAELARKYREQLAEQEQTEARNKLLQLQQGQGHPMREVTTSPSEEEARLAAAHRRMAHHHERALQEAV